MARKFRVTDKGARMLDEEREGVVRSLDRVMAGWPDGDIAAFAAYLRRFNADIERIGGRPWPRPDPDTPAPGPGHPVTGTGGSPHRFPHRFPCCGSPRAPGAGTPAPACGATTPRSRAAPPEC